MNHQGINRFVSSQKPNKKEKILIVEDDQEMRVFIANVLKEAGYLVTATVDSYVGIEMALSNTYNLIILEEKLSIINGKAFVRILKSQKIQVPILLLSDTLTNQAREYFQNFKIKGFILKPFRIETLMKHVRDILPSLQ